MTMMRTRNGLMIALMGLIALAGAPSARAADANATLAADVLAVFKERCADCHGPKGAAKEKKNKYTYILDLPRMAANPKYIVPGNPDKSLLYEQLVKNEMPPPDDADPVTPEQREAVRKWIAAGCPTGAAAVATTGATTTAPTATAAGAAPKASRPFMTRLIAFAGKFHPLAAHTPIAVLMAAAIAEMLYFRYPAPALSHAARFCCVL